MLSVAKRASMLSRRRRTWTSTTFERFLVGPGPEEVETIPLGTANVVRAGGDVTIVARGKGVPDTLAAADTLLEEGIDAEVIDRRCL